MVLMSNEIATAWLTQEFLFMKNQPSNQDVSIWDDIFSFHHVLCNMV